MRVISGYLRSRIITVPKSVANLRPTTDRARETLFNLLSTRIEIEGKNILDLYCGSGSLGIECLSHGSGRCTFVDLFPDTVKRNIDVLALNDKSRIVRNDSVRFLRSLEDNPFDLIFADPPYDYGGYDKLLDETRRLKATIVLEHSEKFFPQEKHSECLFLRKEIGIAVFSFFDFKKYDEK